MFFNCGDEQANCLDCVRESKSFYVFFKINFKKVQKVYCSRRERYPAILHFSSISVLAVQPSPPLGPNPLEIILTIIIKYNIVNKNPKNKENEKSLRILFGVN